MIGNINNMKKQLVLLDFSQVILSNAYIQFKYHQDETMETLYAAVINSLMKYHRKFYNSVIISAIDSRTPWRNEEFKYYKQDRKTKREEAAASGEITFNHDLFYDNQQIIIDKLSDDNIMLQVDKAEGDDIIGAICNLFENHRTDYPMQLNQIFEEIIIVSVDKDFYQLHRKNKAFCQVKQYNPLKDVFCDHLSNTEAKKYLKEHILRGDRGDGIPNFKMPGNALVDKIRQKAITKKLVAESMKQEPVEFCNKDELIYYNRNRKLIDLKLIPVEIQFSIQSKFLDILELKILQNI